MIFHREYSFRSSDSEDSSESERPNLVKKLLRFASYVAVAVAFFALGGAAMYYYQLEYAPKGPIEVIGVSNIENGKPQNVDFSVFWETWDAIQKTYVGRKALDAQNMVYGAAEGLVRSLGDPYTAFMTPQDTKDFETSIAGRFEGIGIEIGLRKGILTVIAPLEGTPAKAAGLRAGDQILRIDDKPTMDLALDQAVKLIRGPQGTEVTLSILRKDFDEPKKITIKRDIIDITSVSWKSIDQDIAHLQIYNFNEKSFWELRKASIEILHSQRKRIIIDLRNNPGGFLESAVDTAGWFLPKGAVVVKEDEGEGEFVCDSCKSRGPSVFRDHSVVILVNEGSASASEILAGALRDERKVKLIGTKTFGKGSVQELKELRDGATIKLTVAKWLTPSGTDITEHGLEPDIAIENKNQDSEDVQLQKAIEVVRGL